MKKVNYVDFFKIYENKDRKSIVISIGEYHEFYNCDDDKSIDVNNIIGDIFAFYKNIAHNVIKSRLGPASSKKSTALQPASSKSNKINRKEIINKINAIVKADDSVNILIEIDRTLCTDVYAPVKEQDEYGNMIEVYESNLFQVCHELLINKKKWKWTPIDTRANLIFLKLLTDITKRLHIYTKYITEIEVYDMVEDLLLYKDDIYLFLEDYNAGNYFKKKIISSVSKIEKLYNKCVNKKYFDSAAIGHLVVNITCSLQDIYCAEFIRENKINIIYTGAAHNKNMDPFFHKNGYKIINRGKVAKTANCTTIDTRSIYEILNNFYKEKISNIISIINKFSKK